MSMYTPLLLQQPRDYLQYAVHMPDVSFGLQHVNAVYMHVKQSSKTNDAVVPKKITRIAFRVFS